jgi:hypothetical protein
VKDRPSTRATNCFPKTCIERPRRRGKEPTNEEDHRDYRFGALRRVCPAPRHPGLFARGAERKFNELQSAGATDRGAFGDVRVKALTIKPKWANMILDGRKTIEVRTWVTRYCGPLAIHAGSPVCAIVAVCNLVAVRAMREADVPLTGGVEFHELLVAWELADVRRIEPIPCKGKLSLWTPPREVLEYFPEAKNAGS